MKKAALFILTLCCTFVVADQASARMYSRSGYNQGGAIEGGYVDCNKEYAGNGQCVCYCPVTKYRCEKYCTCRNEYEPYTCTKRCCRQVPQYYQKTYCRYVPQYYTQTHCRYCPEYYNECETKYRCKRCYDEHCRYIPCTYYKKVCCQQPACQPACPCAKPACPTCQPVCQPACPTCPGSCANGMCQPSNMNNGNMYNGNGNGNANMNNSNSNSNMNNGNGSMMKSGMNRR